MRTAQLNRVEFLQWLAAQGGSHGLPQNRLNIDGGEVTLAWPDENHANAPLIAVPAAELREFVAFVMTYVGTFVPFTAFYRVIAREMLDFLPDEKTVRDDDEVRPLIGVTLADAAMHAGANFSRLADLSVQACFAAPSYVVSRSFAMGYGIPMVEVALQRWGHVRTSLRSSTNRFENGVLERFWKTALDALEPEIDSESSISTLAQFAREIVIARRRGVAANSSLLENVVPNSGLSRVLRHASREDRVRALDLLQARVSEAKVPQSEAAALLGYGVAEVSAGSFSYLPLAIKYSSDYPTAPLWFALFAGLNPESDLLVAGDCLGRRVLRKARSLNPLANEVSADFGYEEFILYNDEGRSRRVRTERASYVEVDLLPGVGSTFRLSRAEELPRAQATQNGPDELAIDRARQLLAEAAGLLGGKVTEAKGSDLFSGSNKAVSEASRDRNSNTGAYKSSEQVSSPQVQKVKKSGARKRTSKLL